MRALFWNSTIFIFIFVLTWEMHLGRRVTYLLLTRPRAFYEDLFTGDFSSWIYNGFQRNYSYCHNKCVQFIHFCSLTLLDPGFLRCCNTLDQPLELHSLFRSSLEVAKTQKCEGCGTNFQHRQFLTYRHVMHLKKFLKAYWLHNWNKKCQYLWEKNVFDHFRQKIVLF